MALVLSGDGSITGNPDITLTESVSIAGTITYEDVTNIDSVGVITARSGIKVTGGNIDAGDILNAVGGVRTNVDGSVVINPASSLSSTAQRFILYKDRSANTDTAVVFTKAGRADFAGRLLSNEWFQSERTDGTNSAFYATVSGVEKLNIRANGSASFAAGAFAIASDGDITTNIRGHGHIELDSSGVFTTPKIKLFSNSGNANFAGEINVGGYNGSSTTTDGVLLGAVGGVYSQLTAATAGTGVLWQGMYGSTFTSRITAAGSATFVGALSAQTIRTTSTGGQITADYNFVTENTASSLGLFIGCSDSGNATTSNSNGGITGDGALFKTSGTFKINHPLPAKRDTHHLVHSFIEGPQADNIYRGVVTLVDGTATIDLDNAARMTTGTFILLNTNVSCFTSNETDWTAVRGSVSGSILTIEAQDNTSTATVSWMVVGERHDQNMIDAAWTDENGRCITEPIKS